MNRISTVQNEPLQLKLLCARTHLYAIASRLLVLQLLLTVAAPVLGAILAMFHPEVKSYVAAFSLFVLVLDSLVLDRAQKLRITRAAKIAEQFDCTVLELPWDQFTAGDKAEPEDIHSAAKALGFPAAPVRLKDWYPVAVGSLPIHIARIVCQRTNLRYDSRLRHSFNTVIKVASFLLVGGLVVSGLVENLKLTEWIITLAPATPILSWAAREYYRQLDTAESIEGVMKEAKSVWLEALAGSCDADHCLSKSREFQNAIYNRRSNSPLVLPLLYRLKRSTLEDEMNEGAADYVRQYEQRNIKSMSQ